MAVAVSAAGLDLDNFVVTPKRAKCSRVTFKALTSQDSAQRRQIGARSVVIVGVGSAAIGIPRIIFWAISENV
jgi:hypothetical protein